jgi:hypothetical protein
MITTDAGRKAQGSIAQARQKTEKVRDDLAQAGAELHLTKEMLERKLPPQDKTGEVRKAMEQNEAVAGNVAVAQEELEHVEALLEQAIAEREALERQLRG